MDGLILIFITLLKISVILYYIPIRIIGSRRISLEVFYTYLRSKKLYFIIGAMIAIISPIVYILIVVCLVEILLYRYKNK